jgi:hypothetical protein
MDKAHLRLVQEMKKSVAEIEKILDKINENPMCFIPAVSNKNNRLIEQKLFEMYDKLTEHNTIDSNNNNLKYADRIAPSGHINIDISGEKISIKMGRIPGKGHNPKMVIDDLSQTFLQQKKEGVTIPKMPKKVIEIIHVYPVDCVAETIRDNDNYNYKAIIDTLCLFTLGSDRGDNCWMIFKTKIAKDFSAGTEIKIYPQAEKCGS